MAKSQLADCTLIHNNEMDFRRYFMITKVPELTPPATPIKTKTKKDISRPTTPTRPKRKPCRTVASQLDRRARCIKTSSFQVVIPSQKSLRTNIPSSKSITDNSRLASQICLRTNEFSSSTTSRTASLCALTSFTFFNKLPMELRFRIWEKAASNPSVIGIRDLEGKSAFCGTSARCSLLLACKESRQEVLKAKKDLKCNLPATPNLYANLEVDTLWLTIERPDLYEQSAIPFWLKVLDGPMKNARKLAISYSLFTRHRGNFSAMVWKLDLNEFILVIDTEAIVQDDVAAFIQPRTAVGRRSHNWSKWKDLTRSENRYLHDAKWTAQCKYNRYISRGEGPAALLARGKRDLSTFKVPNVTIRDVVNSKNVLPKELAALAEEERYFALPDYGDEDEN